MLVTASHNPDNFVLARLPSPARRALAPLLRTEHLAQGTVLTRRLQPVTHAWFPLFGLVSLTISTADGRMVEVAAIGREGAVGIEAAFEPSVALSDSSVQIGGEFSVIRTDHLRSAVASHPSVEAGLCRYFRALTAQLQQSVACNSLHGLDQRCCRWLLAAQDRSGLDELPLTQEMLAGMLGAGRPGISLALGKLERAGLIRGRRGRIRILSRAGIAARACECHDTVDRVWARLEAGVAH
jgi:CRP-like cAMP-binding protein